MADDLCYGCLMSEYSYYKAPDWIRKYMEMRWKDEVREPDAHSHPYTGALVERWEVQEI